ncbi:hypothetical protein ABKN59_011314 [Abortiporus biennis]
MNTPSTPPSDHVPFVVPSPYSFHRRNRRETSPRQRTGRPTSSPPPRTRAASVPNDGSPKSSSARTITGPRTTIPSLSIMTVKKPVKAVSNPRARVLTVISSNAPTKQTARPVQEKEKALMPKVQAITVAKKGTVKKVAADKIPSTTPYRAKGETLKLSDSKRIEVRDVVKKSTERNGPKHPVNNTPKTGTLPRSATATSKGPLATIARKVHLVTKDTPNTPRAKPNNELRKAAVPRNKPSNASSSSKGNSKIVTVEKKVNQSPKFVEVATSPDICPPTVEPINTFKQDTARLTTDSEVPDGPCDEVNTPKRTAHLTVEVEIENEPQENIINSANLTNNEDNAKPTGPCGKETEKNMTYIERKEENSNIDSMVSGFEYRDSEEGDKARGNVNVNGVQARIEALFSRTLQPYSNDNTKKRSAWVRKFNLPEILDSDRASKDARTQREVEALRALKRVEVGSVRIVKSKVFGGDGPANVACEDEKTERKSLIAIGILEKRRLSAGTV